VYIPRYYREGDPGALRDLMRSYSFALLLAGGAAGLQAVHLPLLWRERARDGSAPELGVLAGHVARANPLWHSFVGPQERVAADGHARPGQWPEALCIFSGPHAYVSPAWYSSRPQVPTWNYTAVHAYGAPRVIEDPQWAREQLAELVEKYESARQAGAAAGAGAAPWQLSAEPDYVEKLLPGIVPFEITLTRLEGKFKLNQNKSAADRAGVIAALEQGSDQAGREIAALMRERLDAEQAGEGE
jgi:transcriptional regulator